MDVDVEDVASVEEDDDDEVVRVEVNEDSDAIDCVLRRECHL